MSSGMGHSITQRQLVDRIARYLVSAGGIAVIVAILAIFFFIFREITPLFSTPTARPAHARGSAVGSIFSWACSHRDG